MSILKKLVLLTFMVSLLSVMGVAPAEAYCVVNDSNNTIHVGDFAQPSKKSLADGNLTPGTAACKPGKMLPIQIQKPLKRGVVSLNDTTRGTTLDCEVSPNGVVHYNGENCYMKRGGYGFLNRAPNVHYNEN